MSIEMAAFGRAFLYLGIGFVLIVFYLQWKWARTCSENVRVLIAEKAGGGRWDFAPKEGGEVSIYNPDTGITRTWPINELATIEVTYPGVGFVPKFLQKSIRLVIVNEGDWEPMLNRSPHKQMIASPDVIEWLDNLIVKNPKLKEEIEGFMNRLSTGPTREMIADPSILGSLFRSQVMRALASVSEDLMEALSSIKTQLSRLVGMNPKYTLVALVLIIVLLIFLIYRSMSGDITAVAEDVKAIKESLGIP